MIVDTSVWVASMRSRDDRLIGWMGVDLILQHPFVTAELGMGSFASIEERSRTIDLLDSFEQIAIPDAGTFHDFVARHRLFGSGIGFTDAHLLLAGLANPGARLVTRDRRLAEQAERIGTAVEFQS